jgi:hypothetical protein
MTPTRRSALGFSFAAMAAGTEDGGGISECRISQGGGDQKSDHRSLPRLTDIGITKMQSSRYQHLAAIPEAQSCGSPHYVPYGTLRLEPSGCDIPARTDARSSRAAAI